MHFLKQLATKKRKHLPMADRDYDVLFKIVLVGDANVGKTTLLSRFIGADFSESYKSTIGAAWRDKSSFFCWSWGERCTRKLGNMYIVYIVLILKHPQLDQKCQTSAFFQEFSNKPNPKLELFKQVDFKVQTLQIGERLIKLQIWDTGGQERFAPLVRSYFRGGQGVVIVYDVTHRASFDRVTWSVFVGGEVLVGAVEVQKTHENSYITFFGMLFFLGGLEEIQELEAQLLDLMQHESIHLQPPATPTFEPWPCACTGGLTFWNSKQKSRRSRCNIGWTW